MAIKDILGQRFGKLLVTERHANLNTKAAWLCVCDCGNSKIIAGTELRAGGHKSCGCSPKNPNGSRLRHGHGCKESRTPEYKVWMGMNSRCHNPNGSHFHDYGGRGIGVCKRWEIFENFLADMGERESPDHSLDRIDNDKGYSPENCRWATQKQQQRNRRSNRWIMSDGINATLAEHCERTGVKYKTAHQRLKQGASIEVAISPYRPAYGTIESGGRL